MGALVAGLALRGFSLPTSAAEGPGAESVGSLLGVLTTALSTLATGLLLGGVGLLFVALLLVGVALSRRRTELAVERVAGDQLTCPVSERPGKRALRALEPTLAGGGGRVGRRCRRGGAAGSVVRGTGGREVVLEVGDRTVGRAESASELHVGVVVAEGYPPVVRVDGCLAAVTARHLVPVYAPGLPVRYPSFGTGPPLGGVRDVVPEVGSTWSSCRPSLALCRRVTKQNLGYVRDPHSTTNHHPGGRRVRDTRADTCPEGRELPRRRTRLWDVRTVAARHGPNNRLWFRRNQSVAI